MTIPYPDWLLLAPYPPGDNAAPAPIANWLHFNLTQGNEGTGWIVWNSLPPAQNLGAVPPVIPMPANAMPVKVTYDPGSSAVTIKSGVTSQTFATLTGVWISLPAESATAIMDFLPAQLGIGAAGQTPDLMCGDFSYKAGEAKIPKGPPGGPTVNLPQPVGYFNQPWIAFPVAQVTFE